MKNSYLKNNQPKRVFGFKGFFNTIEYTYSIVNQIPQKTQENYLF